MGGAMGIGNTGPVMEFNIQVSHRVLTSKLYKLCYTAAMSCGVACLWRLVDALLAPAAHIGP